MDSNNYGNPAYSRWGANIVDQSLRSQLTNMQSESPDSMRAIRKPSYDPVDQNLNSESGRRPRGSNQINQNQPQQSPRYQGSPTRFQQENPQKQAFQPQQNQISTQNQQMAPQSQNQTQYQSQLTDPQSLLYQQQMQSQLRPQITRKESQQYQPRNQAQPNQLQAPTYSQPQQIADDSPERILAQEQPYQSQGMKYPQQQSDFQNMQQSPNQSLQSSTNQSLQSSTNQSLQSSIQRPSRQRTFQNQRTPQDGARDYSQMQRSQTQQMQDSMPSQDMNGSTQSYPQQQRMRPQNTNQADYSQQQGNQSRSPPLIQQSIEQRQPFQQNSGIGPRNPQFQDYQQQLNQQKSLSPQKNSQNQLNFIQNDVNPIEEEALYDEQVVPGIIQPKISENTPVKNDPFLQKKGFCVDFKQQNLKGFYFMPSIMCVIICNTLLGLWLMILGGIVLSVSSSVIEIETNYTSCNINDYCTYAVNVSSEMSSPVYVYLKMSNYYQNHLSYVKSYDAKQLFGTTEPQSSLSDCDPVVNVSSLQSYQQQTLGGITLKPSDTANPCGLQAKSFITDTYTLFNPTNTSTITIDTTSIAWSVDINSRFKLNPDYKALQWANVSDERFMNWMNFATTPTWKKLWGKIDQTLSVGIYYLQVQNTYNVTGFDGTKAISLSTVSSLGGTSTMLGFSLIIFGAVYFTIALVIFGYRWYKKMDDDKYYKDLTFDWKK